MKPGAIITAYVISIPFVVALFILPICDPVSAYEMHDPIYIEHQATTEDNPLVIEGYEIANPGGPGIQVLHVDHVIIRNNYIHDCGIEISNRIRDEILNGGKDARAATMRNPRKTGALNIFDAKTVVVSNNKIVNNDYGIRIHSQHGKTNSVEVSDNIVRNNHRSHFIHIQNANNVDVRNNEVVDNGLSLFIDNEGLANAFEKGEDWPDGRSQGIMCDTCRNVKIHGNTVINSSSDGIGLGGELDNNDYAENFEIYNNTVMRNGEQGIWIVASRNGKIHDNKVWKNASRPDTTGGSSGISLEAHVYNVDIYSNDVAYNDMLGILITLSTNISIYDNEIHHNADGAIGWGEWFSRKGRVTSEGFSQGISIRNNDIHDNMGSVFWFMTDVFEDNVIVEKNRFYGNGIRIRHYEEFPDHDISTHPEIWEYDGENILFREDEEQFQSQFRFRGNYIDNELVDEGFN
jgi:parallel beta-helix repeat protein